MIFHSLKAIYFHIGKTAGSSVEKLLHPEELNWQTPNYEVMYGFDSEHGLYLQHATPAFIKQQVSPDVFSSYYKFTIVRNPFVRSLSVYHYLIDLHRDLFGSFENYIHALEEYESKFTKTIGSHHSPQTQFSYIDGELVCDHIAHFENLPHSLDPVLNALGITESLAKHNTYRHHPWGEKPIQDYYNNDMIDIVLDFYRDDFNNFGYSIDINELASLAEKITL